MDNIPSAPKDLKVPAPQKCPPPPPPKLPKTGTQAYQGSGGQPPVAGSATSGNILAIQPTTELAVSRAEICQAPECAIVLDTSCEIVLAGGPKLPTLPPQLEGESDEMYQRFAYYCNAPARGERRSWTATGRRFGVDHKTIMDCARRYDWIERSIAWDRQRTLKAAQTAAELQASTAVSHVSLSQDLVDSAAVVMRKCDEMLAGEMDLEVLQMWQQLASGVSKILEKSQKAARLALGQSDSNQSIHVTHETKPKPIDFISRCTQAERDIVRAAVLIQQKYETEGHRPDPHAEAAIGRGVLALGPGAAA